MTLHGNWDAVLRDLEAVVESNPSALARLFESAPPAPLRQAGEHGQVVLPTDVRQTPGGRVWADWLKGSDLSLASLGNSTLGTCPATFTFGHLEPGVWVSEACYQQLADQFRKQTGISQAQRVKLAEAELRLGDSEAAMVTAERVLESRPSDGWARYWVVRSYDALAYQAFLKVSKLDPDSARVHQMLAKYYADRHETSRAAAGMRRPWSCGRICLTFNSVWALPIGRRGIGSGGATAPQSA